MGDISDDPPPVQIHADLFILCHNGVASTWPHQGHLACHQKDLEMSSLGRIGV